MGGEEEEDDDNIASISRSSQYQFSGMEAAGEQGEQEGGRADKGQAATGSNVTVTVAKGGGNGTKRRIRAASRT